MLWYFATLEILIPLCFVIGIFYASVKGKGVSMNTMEIGKRGIPFTFLMLGLENPLIAFGYPPVFAIIIYFLGCVSLTSAIVISLIWPLSLVIVSICLVVQSQSYGEANQGNPQEIATRQDELLVWNDIAFKNKWRGRKIPIETANEAFQDQKIDYKDVLKVIRSRYDIFKMSLTKSHVKSYIVDLIGRLWKHDSDADKADVSDVYNRGNDWYGWFMDEKMLYSMGYWEDSEEVNLQEKCTKAQNRKLNMICDDILHMKPGDEHLDLGCGWGALVDHATRKFGVKSTGITLSQEQAHHIAKLGENKNLEIKVMNAWQIPDDGKKYDKITCVEMSEHIGIRDYQKFMHKVKGLLKDDGIFYLQIAGLRRQWQYEDLVWGLYMNKYIFPGADASCSVSWDLEQLDRAGFEVHSVENCGTHYGMTILTWYHNWVKNRKEIVATYGEWNWRNWSLFLAWSSAIAMQGSSTVYMISMTKNFPNDKRSRYPGTEKESFPSIDRAKLFIDHDRNGESKKCS